MTKTHLVSVQILRAVAALAVFVFHLAESLKSDFGVTEKNVFEIGAYGVDLFFVISGFIMCYTTRTDQSVPTFIAKRVARITPLYYVLTLGVFAIALLAPQLLNSTTADAGELVKSLAFIPYEKANGLVQPVLFVGWTLNYEMFFYAVFALALLAGRNRVAAACGLFVGIVLLGAVVPSDNVPFNFYTDGIILEFVLGCLVYVAFDKAPHVMARLGWLWPAPALLLLAHYFYEPDLPRAVGWGIPAALLLASLLAVTPPRNAVTRFFERLGDASYSIYLTHAYVIGVFVKLIIPLIGVSIASIVVAAIGSLAVTIAVSLALFALLEKPMNTWVRDRLLRLLGRPRTPVGV